MNNKFLLLQMDLNEDFKDFFLKTVHIKFADSMTFMSAKQVQIENGSFEVECNDFRDSFYSKAQSEIRLQTQMKHSQAK